MERSLRLIVIAVLAFIILKFSTIGWRFWSETFEGSENEDSQLLKNLKFHVYKLAHEIGDRSVFQYTKLEEAADYIANTFKSYGFSVEFQEYRVWNQNVKNIIATKEGLKKPDEIIVVGAHYDTSFNPGADDNASAVAGLLELARLIVKEQVDSTIKFIAFVNEEPPFFKSEEMGSLVYARAAKSRGLDVKAALILESIGYYTDKPNSQQYPLFFGLFYPNKGNFISFVSNLASRRLLAKVSSIFKKNTEFPVETVVAPAFVPGIDFSDNWSFWKQGYPALMVTDTAFYRNPYYHTDQDTYEKLDYASLAEVVQGLFAVLQGLN